MLRYRGVREGQPGGDGDRLQGAVLLPAVPAAALAVAGRDAAPGQVLKLGIQAGLVLLDGQDVVRALARDQELGRAPVEQQLAAGPTRETMPVSLSPRQSAHHASNPSSRHYAEALSADPLADNSRHGRNAPAVPAFGAQ